MYSGTSSPTPQKNIVTIYQNTRSHFHKTVIAIVTTVRTSDVRVFYRYTSSISSNLRYQGILQEVYFLHYMNLRYSGILQEVHFHHKHESHIYRAPYRMYTSSINHKITHRCRRDEINSERSTLQYKCHKSWKSVFHTGVHRISTSVLHILTF
jgi:hypothetical protein